MSLWDHGNITVSGDEGTWWRAWIRAAELDTSVSALVLDCLRTLAFGQAGGVAAETVADAARDGFDSGRSG